MVYRCEARQVDRGRSGKEAYLRDRMGDRPKNRKALHFPAQNVGALFSMTLKECYALQKKTLT